MDGHDIGNRKPALPPNLKQTVPDHGGRESGQDIGAGGDDGAAKNLLNDTTAPIQLLSPVMTDPEPEAWVIDASSVDGDEDASDRMIEVEEYGMILLSLLRAALKKYGYCVSRCKKSSYSDADRTPSPTRSTAMAPSNRTYAEYGTSPATRVPSTPSLQSQSYSSRPMLTNMSGPFDGIMGAPLHSSLRYSAQTIQKAYNQSSDGRYPTQLPLSIDEMEEGDESSAGFCECGTNHASY